jgi:hypothetical protein
MSQRPIASGDFAIVNGSRYLIRKITSEGIYIGVNQMKTGSPCSLLINTEQGWQVYKYKTPHSVSFEAKPPLGWNDLFPMDYYHLKYLEKLKPEVKAILADDTFWKEKGKIKYGEKIIAEKPLNETYANQYRFLATTSALERGVCTRKDGLLLNLQLGYSLSSVTASQAAEMGDLDLIKWLHQKGVIPTRSGVIKAQVNQYKEIIEWCRENNIYPDLLSLNQEHHVDVSTLDSTPQTTPQNEVSSNEEKVSLFDRIASWW